MVTTSMLGQEFSMSARDLVRMTRGLSKSGGSASKNFPEAIFKTRPSAPVSAELNIADQSLVRDLLNSNPGTNTPMAGALGRFKTRLLEQQARAKQLENELLNQAKQAKSARMQGEFSAQYRANRVTNAKADFAKRNPTTPVDKAAEVKTGGTSFARATMIGGTTAAVGIVGLNAIAAKVQADLQPGIDAAHPDRFLQIVDSLDRKTVASKLLNTNPLAAIGMDRSKDSQAGVNFLHGSQDTGSGNTMVVTSPKVDAIRARLDSFAVKKAEAVGNIKADMLANDPGYNMLQQQLAYAQEYAAADPQASKDVVTYSNKINALQDIIGQRALLTLEKIPRYQNDLRRLNADAKTVMNNSNKLEGLQPIIRFGRQVGLDEATTKVVLSMNSDTRNALVSTFTSIAANNGRPLLATNQMGDIAWQFNMRYAVNNAPNQDSRVITANIYSVLDRSREFGKFAVGALKARDPNTPLVYKLNVEANAQARLESFFLKTSLDTKGKKVKKAFASAVEGNGTFNPRSFINSLLVGGMKREAVVSLVSNMQQGVQNAYGATNIPSDYGLTADLMNGKFNTLVRLAADEGIFSNMRAGSLTKAQAKERASTLQSVVDTYGQGSSESFTGFLGG